MKMKWNPKRTVSIVLRFALTCAILSLPALVTAEDWKTAFEDICSKVQGADSLSQQEIEDMIKKADKILPEIQASSDTGKKVYITRLKRCRGVYEFMLDTKKSSAK